MSAAAIAMGIGAVGGLAQTISGIISKSKNQKLLDNLEVPDLNNAFEDVQISTMGSDLMKEQNAIGFASGINSLQSGGVRSVMGGLPKLASFYTDANKEARTYLDSQVQQKQYAVAQDNQRIRQMTENRYLGEVQGLGNAISTANENIWGGIKGIAGAGMYGARNGVFDKKD